MTGGPVDKIPNLNNYKEGALWVGVDSGVNYLLKHQIVPTQAFGDFDSVTESQFNEIKNRLTHLSVFPSEKDETDTEIAINWSLKKNPSLIRVFGATGGRLDHFMGNIQLLLKGLEHGTRIEIHDNQNILYIVKEGSYTLSTHHSFPYVSFLPVSKSVKGITLTGFKFPLENRNIRWGDTLCISNELEMEKGTFSFHEGILMVVRSRDYHPS